MHVGARPCTRVLLLRGSSSSSSSLCFDWKLLDPLTSALIKKKEPENWSEVKQADKNQAAGDRKQAAGRQEAGSRQLSLQPAGRRGGRGGPAAMFPAVLEESSLAAYRPDHGENQTTVINM